MKIRHRRNATFLALALLLNGCTAIPLKTLYKLATTDMMTVDPTDVRVAVRVPEWFAEQLYGVTMTIGTSLEDKPLISEAFKLESIPLALTGKTLNAEQKKGFNLYAYRIKPSDIARVLQTRELSKKHKAESGNKVQGSLLIHVDACRKATLPEGEIPVSTYLRFDVASDFMPLTVDYDLKQEATGKELEAILPLCQAAGTKQTK
jgi:hypothetical protein